MDQMRLRCAIYRGGTSKAIFFKENELPSDPLARDKVIMAVFGSPDIRQIDGLGGADITTSKVAIIGPSSRQDADVDYTFGQVMLDKPVVSFQGNCGNISSAVGPYSVDEGLVRAVEPISKIRIHNTNTKKILKAEFSVSGGKALAAGDCSIPGVPGTGALVQMDWAETAGSATGKLLPTGNVTDILDVNGFGKIKVSIVDAGNPVVFILAEDVGLKGTEHRGQLNSNDNVLEILEKIRSAGAQAAGIVQNSSTATSESPLAPQIAFVCGPMDYTDYASGEVIKKGQISFLSRIIFGQMPVEAYTGTGSICTSAAAMIPGTLVNLIASSKTRETGKVKIGHARGVLEIDAKIREENGHWLLEKAIMKRTARRLMEGYVFVKKT